MPRSFNVPDGVVAHIDDIVIPVSWRTVDERNSLCYVVFVGGADLLEANFTFDSRNYEGEAFAASLAAKLTATIAGFEVEREKYSKEFLKTNEVLTQKSIQEWSHKV